MGNGLNTKIDFNEQTCNYSTFWLSCQEGAPLVYCVHELMSLYYLLL